MIKEEERELYEYAYLLLISEVFNIIGAVIIGIFFRDMISVFVYLAVFIPLRHYAGGYHSKTPEQCSVSSFLILFAACALQRTGLLLRFRQPFAVICIVSVAAVWWLSPVASVNKPLDEKEKERYRRTARGILGISLLFLVILWYFRLFMYCVMPALALTGVALLQVLGVLKRRSELCGNDKKLRQQSKNCHRS